MDYDCLTNIDGTTHLFNNSATDFGGKIPPVNSWLSFEGTPASYISLAEARSNKNLCDLRHAMDNVHGRVVLKTIGLPVDSA